MVEDDDNWNPSKDKYMMIHEASDRFGFTLGYGDADQESIVTDVQSETNDQP